MTGTVVAAILVPMGVGALLFIARRIGGWVRGGLTLATVLAACGSVGLLWVQSGGVSHGLAYFGIIKVDPAPLLLVDPVGLVLAALFCFVWLLVTVYSLQYLKDYPFQNDYYGFFLIMLGAVIGLCFSQNLVMTYLFWEMAGVATWRLVAFFRGEREVAVAQKTLLINFVGSVLMLVGFALVFVEQGTVTLSDLAGGRLSTPSALLVLAGIVTKSASLPFYIWLPDAHTVAPSPMSALLSGIVAKIGLVVYLRFFVQAGLELPYWLPYLVAGIGVGGSLIAAGCAMRENDYKRLLALSTVSQLGYIFIGFALAGGYGATAGLVYLVAHCIAKAGLFMAMGAVEQATHKRDLRQLGGLLRVMPVTGVAVAVLALSVIGLPPFLGFFGKFYVVLAAVRENLLVAIGALVAAVMTAFYMLRLYRMFVGEPREPVAVPRQGAMVAMVAVAAVVTLGLGLAFAHLSGYLGQWLSASGL